MHYRTGNIQQRRIRIDAERIPVLNEDGQSNWEEMYPVKLSTMNVKSGVKLGQLDIWEREKAMYLLFLLKAKIFKKEYFRYYDPNTIQLEECSVFIACDLAISEKETADFTSVCAVAVNPDNHWFLLEIDYGRWDPTKTIDTIFQMVQKYRPIYVGIEKSRLSSGSYSFCGKGND